MAMMSLAQIINNLAVHLIIFFCRPRDKGMGEVMQQQGNCYCEGVKAKVLLVAPLLPTSFIDMLF